MVLILERVPTSLRGELTRWLLEPKAGVFVGRVSAMVRDKLWDKARTQSRGGGCLMVHSSNCEQGYRIQSCGNTSRVIEDFGGLALVRLV
jgi:CRISPR-associated protein Cas2